DRAAELFAARQAAVPGLRELVRQILTLPWNDATATAAKQNARRLPDGCSCGSLEAKLDREKGLWTVHGVYEIGSPDSKAAWELDWKHVVKYTTLGWETVNFEGSGPESLMGQPRPFHLPDGRVFYLPDVKDPARCGWRPVLKKDDKVDR